MASNHPDPDVFFEIVQAKELPPQPTKSYYDSKTELLEDLELLEKNFSQLRASVHCDRPLAGRENFWKRISTHVVSLCKTTLQEKLPGFLSATKESHEDEFNTETFSAITDFTECCKAIDKELQIINGKYDDQLIPVEDLDETRRQLLERKVSLSFYGQYNSGKSTLLNAILQNKFLPVKKDPETSLRLIIQPVSETEEFAMACGSEMDVVCSNDAKKNYLCKDDNIEASGVMQVHDTLKKLNEQLREKKGTIDNISVYVLKTQIPLSLSVPGGWQVSLIDNPGFDEYNPHITETALQSLKVSSAYLYITTYDQYRQTQSADFFLAKYKDNKEIFKEHRLIIVVNKLDQVCCSNCDDCEEEEELTPDMVASKVQSFIQDICECGAEDIPREVVIPVYGMWAYKARMLAREPTKAERKRAVVKILSEKYDHPIGQGENPENIITMKSSDELAKELEQMSNICELEKRLQGMANGCIFVWIEKIKKDLSNYALTSRKNLTEQREEVQTILKDSESTITRRLRAMKDIYELYKGIIDSTNPNAPRSLNIWKNLKEKYDLDMQSSDPKSKVVREIRRMVNEFKEGSIDRERAENYDPRCFEEDVAKFLKGVSTTFNSEIRSCFSEVLLTRGHHLSEVDRDVSRMATLMERICPSTEEYESMRARESGDGIPVLVIPDFKTATATVQAPNVYVSLFEVIKELCQDAIKAIQTKFSRTSTSEDSQSTSGIPNNYQNEQSEATHNAAEVPESTFESSPTNEQQDTTEETQRVSEPSTAANIESDSILSSHDQKGRTQSTFNDRTLSTSSTHGTPKKVLALHKTMRWREEMVNAVESLGTLIDEVVQKYFDNFEQCVLTTYWKSYCESAKKRLMNFDEAFNVQLNTQIESLKRDIKQFLQRIEKHKSLTYHSVLLSFLSAQLLTIADNYKMSLQ